MVTNNEEQQPTQVAEERGGGGERELTEDELESVVGGDGSGSDDWVKPGDTQDDAPQGDIREFPQP